jgi:hypothetical protein
VVTGGSGTPSAPGPSAPNPSGQNLDGRTAAAKDDESTLAELALPLGIAAAVVLVLGAGFYGLRRR